MQSRILDINHPYIPAAKTNVYETLKRFGFEPPSEDLRYQEKWRTYRNSFANNEIQEV
jgi:hypothetical protein